VIAYDRLIRDSGDVSYYATFDNFKVGVQQATSLVAGLEAALPRREPWNVEFFGGSPDDNNAYFFYDGAMSVLQPLIDEGKDQHQVGPDGHGHGRHAALGRRGRAGAHG
jgi:putative multiple sugar transport system substrate-binding protein